MTRDRPTSRHYGFRFWVQQLLVTYSSNCSGLVSPSTPRVEGARIVGNSD